MQIKRTDNISYKGLGQKLGKSICSASNIKRLQDFYSYSNPNIVGNLPHQWIKNMPYENRATNIKQLYEKLGQLIHDFNFNDTDSFQTALNTLLKEHKAIKQEDHIQVAHEAIGAFANCYKLQSSNPEQQTLLLKRFKGWTYHGYDWMYEHRHGAVCEINTKNYVKSHLKRNEDKALFTNFHYGDMKNGYYLEDYQKSAFDREKEIKLIYSDNKFVYNCLKKITQVLAKINLCHGDLKPENVIFYANKNGRICAACCDVGGVHPLL